MVPGCESDPARGRGDGVGTALGNRQPHRVTAYQHDAALFAGGGNLVAAEREHRTGEIHAQYTRSAATPLACFERHVSSAGADIDQRLSTGELQRSDRSRPPALVDPSAEQMIQQVVTRRDRVEHAGNAIRRLVGCLHDSHGAHEDGLTTEHTDITFS